MTYKTRDELREELLDLIYEYSIWKDSRHGSEILEDRSWQSIHEFLDKHF